MKLSANPWAAVIKPEKNWAADNGGFPLLDEEVKRYLSVIPSKNQLRQAERPFYAFLHFGMNTATGREWGSGKETAADFTIEAIDCAQWAETVKASGAAGMILTCKHHDGFCLWDTAYTDFSVMNSPYGQDIVRQAADACKAEGLSFGVYLSPWDMHEKTYGTPAYNDYFCNQLTELLTGYGEIFEVWFDGAKGEAAEAFDYDWNRYYETVRRLQPGANIAVCGPDLRWVGNEAGKTRKAEFSVVPEYLTRAETVQKHSQHREEDGEAMKALASSDEDLGSRAVLRQAEKLCWYPAEVDVSIRRGWFYHEEEDSTVKPAEELFSIYLNSVGNNCCLLLNVPPDRRGRICEKDEGVLRELGEKVRSITRWPVLEEAPGELSLDEPVLFFSFDEARDLGYCVLEEELGKSQRVEAFDLYLKLPEGGVKKAYSGTVIGGKKIIPLSAKAVGAALVIRQSRGAPVLKKIGFYGAEGRDRS